MSGAKSAKDVLSEYSKKQYQAFILNNDELLKLLVVSSVPGIGASERQDTYKKIISHPGQDQHIKFIKKNNKAHSFVWQTTSAQLKKAARWGIIKTHSITSKVSSTLGGYRISAHERIAKGLISNTQVLKIRLLDLYQDRFEALEDLESLVNKNNNFADYEAKIQAYIHKLESIKEEVPNRFTNRNRTSLLDLQTMEQINQDLQADIARARSYLEQLRTQKNLDACNAARGTHSILEFVKQQMIQGLYEFQGINQDLTFSADRDFALTRGEMNDFIEDARKVIDDHQADLHNAVTKKHHGLFSKDEQQLISYDFLADDLSTKREREILLGISFIEGWDTLDDQELTVSNQSGTESLDLIHATKWKNHRNLTALFTSFGYFILNFFKSIVLPTQPWEEESWSNKNFHLEAVKLRKHCTPNEPMWQKPVRLFKKIGHALYDIFKGVRNFGSQLTIKMPDDIENDWKSTTEMRPLAKVLEKAKKDIDVITKEEDSRLAKISQSCNFDIFEQEQNMSASVSKLATVEYELNPGEQNDLLTSMARGLNEFASVFSHHLYAKDPIAGLVFSAGYAVGAAAIVFPGATASLLGSAYVKAFSDIAYSVGSSKVAAVISGASTQAQVLATGWDTLVHGPSGNASSAFYKLGEDPITIAAYLATATILGHLLVNGINGHTIPWLSEFLKEDLGSAPEASYPFIGTKFAILLYEGFAGHKKLHNHPQLPPLLVKLVQSVNSSDPEQQRVIEQFKLICWLSANAHWLPKLKGKQLFELSRHIESLFNKEQSKSLKKLLYPETHYSIAFQVFSIPLSYIPAIIRFAIALILSLAALVTKRQQPFEPIKRAANNLYDKVSKDLSRLIIFGNQMVHLCYTGITVIPKAFVYTSVLIFGRIASLFHSSPGHSIYKGFGSVHLLYKNVIEWFHPSRALRSVEAANPIHTINQVESSFAVVMTQLGFAESDSDEDSSEPSCLPPPLSPSNSDSEEIPPPPEEELSEDELLSREFSLPILA